MSLDEKIFLGFFDEPITSKYEAQVDHTTNKVGGLPVANSINELITGDVLCPVCHAPVPLLLQIYAPIVELPNYHRTLYIYGCIGANCVGNSESWVCYKEQSQVIEEPLTVQSIGLPKETVWCDDADDWGADSDEFSCSEQTNQVNAMMNRLELNTENDSSPNDSSDIECLNKETDSICIVDDFRSLTKQVTATTVMDTRLTYIPYFISVLEETLDVYDPMTEHAQQKLTLYEKQYGKLSELEFELQPEGKGEKYEKILPQHGDKLFHNFIKRVQKNPNQIVRYCRNNEAPLCPYPLTDIPQTCPGCDGAMVFEMQILPSIIGKLKLQNSDFEGCVEFGSVYVYTCLSSCSMSSVEVVRVQLEQLN